MSKVPHDTVVTELLDAVTTGPVLTTGGIDRKAVECADALHAINANLVRDRYREERPGSDDNGSEEGRRLLAVDGVAWLLEQGHLRVVDGGGLALGKPFIEANGEPYAPGKHFDQDVVRPMRHVAPGRRKLIEESVERLPGLKKYFPVLLDEDDNVVDGRHRLAVDPQWPAAAQRVPRADRVATAVAANRTNAWGADEWRDLSARAESVYGKKLAVGELARLALLEDPVRENEVIAGLVGCSEFTVRQVRGELEELPIISVIRFTPGPRLKDGSRRRSKSLEAKRTEEIAAINNGSGGPARKPAQQRKTENPELQQELRRRLTTGGKGLEARELADRFAISPSSLHTAAVQARAAYESEQVRPPEPPPVFTSEAPVEPAVQPGSEPKPKPKPKRAPPVTPDPLMLAWTEDARVLAKLSYTWMTDPNVLLEWGNRLVSEAKRKGAS